MKNLNFYKRPKKSSGGQENRVSWSVQKNNNIKSPHIYNYCLSLSVYCCMCFQHGYNKNKNLYYRIKLKNQLYRSIMSMTKNQIKNMPIR